MAANPGGPSSQGQGSPMGQRDLATSGFAAGAQAADAPPSVDAMERLILEREQKMEREAGILRQLKAQLSPGNREISMQLSPAALGKVSMKLAMREGRMTASMVTETKEALEALENQLPELKAALEAQGFEVVDFKLELGANLGDEPGFHSDQQLAAPREMTGSLAAGLAGQAPDQRAENTASKNASSAAASRRGGVDAWG
jgi:flagellar hook-length control protein FliK